MTGMVDEPGSTPGPTVPGDITRLNPVDGLFLRGEHLDAIQDYARELVRAIGTGAGSGVVYGYTATLDGDNLRVGPGLASDPQGRPLRSNTEAVLQLKDPPALDSSGNGFLVVEVGPAEWPSGHEKVYGEVCGDGCSGSGSTIQPWIGEGITVELVARSIEGLSTAGSALRRNRLASLYFDQERRNGHPWLQPDGEQPVIPVTGWNWNAGAPAAKAAHVPIAALLAVDGKWVLDVWTARRDVDGPPAKNVWQNRLSMRPWSTFMAQVLQFQAQLTAHASELAQLDFDAEAFTSFEPLRELSLRLKLTRAQEAALGKDFLEKVAKAAKALPLTPVKTGKSLRAMGFEELPPAGYLPIPKAAANVESAVRLLLGNRLDYRFLSCSADYVTLSVEESQHRDRIPLTEAKHQPEVDILIPGPADGPAYGWVAFVHRSCCEIKETPPAAEPVDVYFRTFEGGADELQKIYGDQPKIEGNQAAELLYPPSDWSYPGNSYKVAVAFTDFLKNEGLEMRGCDVYLVGLAPESRLPLIAVRASMLAASLDSGLMAPVFSFSPAAGQREAIIIAVEPRR
ncbi:hypothetical protein [Paenarthrobacter sp. PH39-S1]|uniref:hypothetical protein n=1 Tax=Paenarthrobacter sp. PH39-S1 TaxID=3046204 RepID=UPI0024BB6A39|nr:hypothetical protein [Paenarthrobacter sp. PH39-S1]MDJ0355283.1 hypothetical protein [Paenarthrobacter sp. PH39-S1]